VATGELLLLRPCRLVVVTDWDAGFQLQPSAEPLPDVSPGGDYIVECVASQSVLIQEVLVRDFALVEVATAAQTIKVAPIPRGALPRLYRLDAAITAHADDCISVRLYNEGPASLKRKVATLVRKDAAAVRIDPAPTGRAEDVVACPACGKAPGDSCDGPASHPSRMMLHIERAKAAAELPVILAAHRPGDARGVVSRCPTCASPVRAERREVVGDTRARCDDAWHAGPVTHVPQVTSAEDSGGVAAVHGCSCGADVASTAAFADHVGVPRDAVQSILTLAEIAYDLLYQPKKLARNETRRQITRCLEFVR
jgi:hypothetical protein